MRRVTITMPDETFERVQQTVERTGAASVSAFLTALADEKTREMGLLEILDALDREHGPPSAEDEEWARSVIPD